VWHERQLEGRRSATKSEENTTGKPAAQLHEPATLTLLAAAAKGVCALFTTRHQVGN
jgi:hypothetical protein